MSRKQKDCEFKSPHRTRSSLLSNNLTKAPRIGRARQRIIALPSRKEHYDLEFKGNLFTDSDLTINFHTGGSLKTFELSKSSDIDSALSALGGSLESVNTALEEIDKKKAGTVVDPVDAENQKLGLEIMNLMLEANRDAIAQGKTPPYPNFLQP